MQRILNSLPSSFFNSFGQDPLRSPYSCQVRLDIILLQNIRPQLIWNCILWSLKTLLTGLFCAIRFLIMTFKTTLWRDGNRTAFTLTPTLTPLHLSIALSGMRDMFQRASHTTCHVIVCKIFLTRLMIGPRHVIEPIINYVIILFILLQLQ